MIDIDLIISLSEAHAVRLNLLRQHYNYVNAKSLDKNGFATLLIREATISRWKQYHNNFVAILDAYATATDAEQDQIKTILGL